MPPKKKCLQIKGKDNTVPCYSHIDGLDEETQAYNSKCMTKRIGWNKAVVAQRTEIQPRDCQGGPPNDEDLECPRCGSRVYFYAAFNYGNGNTAYIPVTQNLKPINP